MGALLEEFPPPLFANGLPGFLLAESAVLLALLTIGANACKSYEDFMSGRQYSVEVGDDSRIQRK